MHATKHAIPSRLAPGVDNVTRFLPKKSFNVLFRVPCALKAFNGHLVKLFEPKTHDSQKIVRRVKGPWMMWHLSK